MMNLRTVFAKLFWWALVVWVAVALLSLNPIMGLGSALVGGILFGLVLFK